MASYFYDYYRFTGDRAFLAKRAIPLMKEIALFYEDFLIEKDAKGHYIYRPSMSPEVGALIISDNSTFDVAIAKELLTNLIEGCQELGIEQKNVRKWQAMLKNMPPYQIGPGEDLAEWADGSFRHAYNHRHHSPFYPVFRSFEFSPETTPKLWKAAKVALQKKGDLWLRNRRADWWGIPFGRAFHAQSAAYLGQGDVVDEIVNSMADRVYPSLHMSLRPNGGIFNFDGNGAFPDIINRSLAFSLGGTLDLLRSVPPSWPTGSIRGILVRGQIRIDRLQWNQIKGIVDLELTSSIAQQITLRVPASKSIDTLKIIEGAAKVDASVRGPNARKVTLPADRKVRMEIHYDAGSFTLPPVVPGRTSLAQGCKATASGSWPRLGPGLAFDGDLSTRWGGTPKSTDGWLAVDLGVQKTFSKVRISEFLDRIKRFELQVKNGSDWKTIHAGTTVGRNFALTVKSVKAQHVRLNILEATDVPTIWEVELFGE